MNCNLKYDRVIRKNIYQDGKLMEEGTTEYSSVVQTEGKYLGTMWLEYYFLLCLTRLLIRMNGKPISIEVSLSST
jgi:hypothetical protein